MIQIAVDRLYYRLDSLSIGLRDTTTEKCITSVGFHTESEFEENAWK